MTTLREALKLNGGGIISLVGAGGKTSLMSALAAELSGSGDRVLATTTTKIAKPEPSQAAVVVVEKNPGLLIGKCRTALKDKPVVIGAADRSPPRNKLVGFSPETIAALWRSGIFRWIIVEADGAARKPIKAPADHEPVIPAGSKWVVGLVGLLCIGEPFSDRWVFRPDRFRRISGLNHGEPISPAAVAAALVHPQGILKGSPGAAAKIFFLNQADTPRRLDNGRKIVELLKQNPGACGRVIIGQLMPAPQVVEFADLDPSR